MAKKMLSLEERLEGPFHGQVRVVNYVDGFALNGDGYPEPVIRYRIEQYKAGDWGLYEGEWIPVKVYQEQPDGSLTEVPQ